VVAYSQSTTEPQSARSLGIASIVFSIIGIVVGIILIILIVVFFVVVGTTTYAAYSDAIESSTSVSPYFISVSYYLRECIRLLERPFAVYLSANEQFSDKFK